MGKIPSELREAISGNIKEERLKKFPGYGGSKKCSKAFGVSQQQWSPWERGLRVPDETRQKAIAAFFEVTVEYLRRPKNQKQIPFHLWQKGAWATAEDEQSSKLLANDIGEQLSDNLPSIDFKAELAKRKRHAIEAYCKCIFEMIMLGIRVDVAPILSMSEESSYAVGGPKL